MEEKLEEIQERLNTQGLKKDDVIVLYKKAFDIIEKEYDKNIYKSLENTSIIKFFFSKWGKINTSLFHFFGGYLCSEEKKTNIENDILNFIYETVNQKKQESTELSISVENKTDKYETKYYDTIEIINSLKEEIREKNKEIEENKKQVIKYLQKILGMIGPEPQNSIDEKIVNYINDLYDDFSIKVIWTTDIENEKNIFDVLKTTLTVEHEVRFPALVSDNIVVEKGLIYRKEK